ncbi:catechol 2,3-dioxygenase [Paraburkholderia fungorum]|uniref:Catechol 2,3-dioxygenase n=1 Tax=Paraburkholderia fungorum TaxID=134537 RepID=A0AAP5QK15_9BURK|nr:catechol 2,3-dioxygenase [Paraburkholderia fungorum]MDT8843692.1 catechol 2,3-dioxygenase [Paraburkholderia fungorum]PZR45644.1 MAG: catechol 2,3-dioxygenase [Paraburkholderia fungorum]
MGVMRIGHVSVKVMDVEAAMKHYVNVVGMDVTHRDSDGTTYLKCWDEWDKYSVVLIPSDRAMLNHIAYKVETEADLDVLGKRVRDAGVEVTEVPAGQLPFCGRSVRFRLPSAQTMYLYAQKEFLGKDVGVKNPDPWPDTKHGIGAHWLDHCLILGELDPEKGINRVEETFRLLTDALDFHLSERIMAGPNYSVMAGAFMFRSCKPHDIAIVGAPTDGFHHLSFFLDDWKDVLLAGDILSKNRTRIELLPSRHGITRGETVYFYDPSGIRNETFAGLGYQAYPDMPVITWTEDELARAIFYTSREWVESFSTAYIPV